MRHLSILFVLFIGLISVKAKIPSYIKTCSRNDPRIEDCIKNSITNLTDKLGKGIPELEVPSIRGLKFNRVSLELGPGLAADIRDVELDGLEGFILDDISADIASDKYSFKIRVPEIVIRGFYEIDANIGSVPLRGKGPIFFAPKSIVGHGVLHGKKVHRGGKTLYYFPSMDLKLIIGDYKIRLENLFDGDETIGPATNKLLNEEKTEVLSTLIPGLERAVIEKILFIANNICKHFTWDELFPES